MTAEARPAAATAADRFARLVTSACGAGFLPIAPGTWGSAVPMAALFGVTGPLSTAGGWLNGNVYANFLPLVLLLLTIGYGAASLAGQDEDGTLCLIATLPMRRATVVLQKALAMALQAAVLVAAVAVCVFAGRWFDLATTAGDVVSTGRPSITCR